MSSSSRSKSKGKKAGKEPSKASLKPSGHVNSNGVISASGCNPLLGAFHALETAPAPSASPPHVNGHLRNIDDEDQNGNSVGNGIEYDSVSNNGSWSGDSEDHKEKTSQPPPRQETVPGADNDKREKIRQKNEKKHQRQKERRAQELHERCNGYLMSRKLEALAQQLVAMGFSQEKATMALILNEGRVEESVAWLFDGGADDKPSEHTLDGGGNLKIDITEELARITEMEFRYKASKQEVERVVVTCEGDLEMAKETLKAQKREPPASPPKPEETSDPPVANAKQMVSSQNSMRVLLTRPSSSTSIQQKRAEKDFNYTKLPTTTTPLDPGAQSVPAIPPKMEWPKPQQIALPSEKRWPVPGSNPSVSYSIASSLQASPPPARAESHHVAVGNELKGLQLGSVREAVSAMQLPQSISLKQNPSSIISSSPPGMAVGRYPNRVETTMANVLVQPAVTRSLSPHGVSSNPSFNLRHYQSQQQFASVNGHLDPQGTMRQTSSWSRGCPSPTVAAASSLGLFSGPGINGSSGSSSPPVDWTTGSSMFQCDYSNIDWSLDRGGMSTHPNGLWTTARTHNSFSYGSNVNSAMRPVLSNGSGGAIPGLQGRIASSENSSGLSQEWTTPFEERDLFGLSRQFVTSPSL